jgi:glutamine synthetase
MEEMQKSSLVRSALGDYLLEKFMEAKRQEWNEYRLQVSDWETKRYLQI